MKKIYLPKTIKNPAEICAYSQVYMMQKYPTQYYSAKCIAYELGLKEGKSPTIIKDAIRSLISAGHLDGYEEDGLFRINNSSFDMRGRGVVFTTIYYEDIITILSSNRRYKMPLVGYYATMFGTLNNSNKVGFHSINKLAEMCGISPSTAISYNKELEDLKIIYIVHTYTDDHKTNMYGHYSNTKRINTAVKQRDINQPIIKNSKSNWLRSVSARYNRYISIPENEREFDAALYNDVIKYNEEMDQLQLKQPGDDYTRRKKDISVFHLTLEV